MEFSLTIGLVNENGEESVICYRSDGIGIERIRKIGIEVAIISSEVNNLDKRSKIKIHCKNAIKEKDKARRNC